MIWRGLRTALALHCDAARMRVKDGGCRHAPLQVAAIVPTCAAMIAMAQRLHLYDRPSTRFCTALKDPAGGAWRLFARDPGIQDIADRPPREPNAVLGPMGGGDECLSTLFVAHAHDRPSARISQRASPDAHARHGACTPDAQRNVGSDPANAGRHSGSRGGD